jgi:hypothetical protein
MVPANRMKASREHRVPLACITGAGCTGVSYANFCFFMHFHAIFFVRICIDLHNSIGYLSDYRRVGMHQW